MRATIVRSVEQHKPYWLDAIIRATGIGRLADAAPVPQLANKALIRLFGEAEVHLEPRAARERLEMIGRILAKPIYGTNMGLSADEVDALTRYCMSVRVSGGAAKPVPLPAVAFACVFLPSLIDQGDIEKIFRWMIVVGAEKYHAVGLLDGSTINWLCTPDADDGISPAAQMLLDYYPDVAERFPIDTEKERETFAAWLLDSEPHSLDYLRPALARLAHNREASGQRPEARDLLGNRYRVMPGSTLIGGLSGNIDLFAMEGSLYYPEEGYTWSISPGLILAIAPDIEPGAHLTVDLHLHSIEIFQNNKTHFLQVMLDRKVLHSSRIAFGKTNFRVDLGPYRRNANDTSLLSLYVTPTLRPMEIGVTDDRILGPGLVSMRFGTI